MNNRAVANSFVISEEFSFHAFGAIRLTAARSVNIAGSTIVHVVKKLAELAVQDWAK